MSKHAFVKVCLTTFAVLPLACGGGFVPTSRYANATGSEPNSAWEKLATGRRIVVSAREGCAITAGASLADLEAGRGGPLSGAGAQLFTIRDSLVKPGSTGFVGARRHSRLVNRCGSSSRAATTLRVRCA